MKHYITIEQSKRLLELGLSSESADMVYSTMSSEEYPEVLKIPLEEEYFERLKDIWIPCWSLGALLEVIPKYTSNYSCFFNQDGVIHLSFMSKIINNDIYNTPKLIQANTPIEAAYNMLVWLLENNYIKKGE